MPRRPSAKPARVEELEAWWTAIARVVGFCFGAFLIYGQSQAPDPPGAQAWIIFAGVAFAGPTVANTFARIVEAFRGSGQSAGQPAPPEPPA